MAYIGKSPQNGVRNRFVYAATQGQTAFTGADADSKTLAISDQLYTDVYQNGVKLKLTTDWSATTTTVTLVNAASVDDVREIVSFDVFGVPDTVPASTGGTFNGAISATSYGAVSGTTGTFSGAISTPAATITTATNEEDALLVEQADGTDVGALRINNGRFILSGRNSSNPVQIQTHDGNEDIEVDPDGFIKMETAGAERLRIDASGNVGIGVTSPSCILHASTGSSGSGLIDVARFENEGTSANDGARIQLTAGSSTSGAGIGCLGDALNSAHLVFHAGGNTERMRLTSSGHLLVGSTTNVAANAKIFAKGSGVGIAVGYGTGSSEYRHLYMNSGDGSLYFFNNTNYANLSASGAWTNASDRRIKKNIVDIKYGLEDVLKIQTRSYQMKEVSGDHIGLIAQEVEEIIPEVVSGDPEKQLCLNYGSLVAVAFKAIQEQQTVIESLKTRITALEAE